MGKGQRLKRKRAEQRRRQGGGSAIFSASDLAAGIVVNENLRVRLAGAADRAVVSDYLRDAIQPRPGEELPEVPEVCPSILGALDGGSSAARLALAEVMTKAESEGPAAFSLVAVNADDEIVGAIVCSPPYNYISQLCETMPDQAQMMTLQGIMGVSKLVGVATRPDVRGTGVGSALIDTARTVLRRYGAIAMYGSCRAELVQFYRSRRFTVQPLDHPIDMWAVFGINSVVSAPGEHIFVDHL